jgi:hypothetical protein
MSKVFICGYEVFKILSDLGIGSWMPEFRNLFCGKNFIILMIKNINFINRKKK